MDKDLKLTPTRGKVRVDEETLEALQAPRQAKRAKHDYYRPDETTTVRSVAHRWAIDGDKLYDVDWTSGKYHIKVPMSELIRYREYRRDGDEGHADSAERIDALEEKIGEEGWKDPVHITVYRNGDEPKLSEGNHRLVVAQRLGLTELPVVFFFYRGR